MRPDEHKRRKNTQYKKKHGITATDNNQGKKEKDSQAKSSNRGKSEGATKTEETKLPSRPQKAQVLNSQEYFFLSYWLRSYTGGHQWNYREIPLT